MNPNYVQTRFKAVVTDGPIPPKFAIVTACNPDGLKVSDTENKRATNDLRQELLMMAIRFFPVTGGSPDFAHAEEGFGIDLDSVEQAVALGRRWRQEAVFWVEDGKVELCSCTLPKRIVVGHWHDLACVRSGV